MRRSRTISSWRRPATRTTCAILRELGMTSVMIVPLRARGRTLGGLSLIAAESRRRFGPADLALAEEVGRRAGLAADNARLYGEVVATDRRKDEFIALLAHELRNPLAPLRNGLQVMRLAAEDANAIAQARAMMDRQLGHMVRLIDDLLDVSRINQNKMELRRSRVLLADVVSSAVETARPAVEAAGHELTVSLPQRPVFLDADLTRLAQVFSNLLTNSAKYTEQGGRIWLTAEQRGGEVVVSVRDTGIGIPAEVAGYHLRHVLAGGPQHRAQHRRPGHRAGAGQGAGRDARRHGDGRERRARQGQHVHRHAAGHAGSGRAAGRGAVRRRPGRDRGRSGASWWWTTTGTGPIASP